MKILGIDPGTVVMGYGIIEGGDDRVVFIDCGAISVPKHLKGGERLEHIYHGLTDIIRHHHPDVMAIEQPFVAKNARSALAIGRAQAVALLAAALSGIPAYEYTPAHVKQTVASYGASSKEQVQEMVRLQLGLAEPPQPSDAADALAVALCHCREVHLSDLLTGQQR
ncbi:MAG: crossover junction endodeoxyribonuclease RuvC [Dehalococcoidales bacterium]|nr:crossover junction endodeoxyribonuclease RuvC [Dehalococcoidales bacterium]